MLYYLDNNQDNLITVIDNSDISKKCLSKNKITLNYIYSVNNIRQTNNEFYVFDTNISLNKNPFEVLYSYFEKDGYRKNQIYIYEYPYDIYLPIIDMCRLWDCFTVKYVILGNRIAN